MPSPGKRKQRKLLLREQEREEVEAVLPVEEEVKPEPVVEAVKKTTRRARKAATDLFSSTKEDDKLSLEDKEEE